MLFIVRFSLTNIPLRPQLQPRPLRGLRRGLPGPGPLPLLPLLPALNLPGGGQRPRVPGHHHQRLLLLLLQVPPAAQPVQALHRAMTATPVIKPQYTALNMPVSFSQQNLALVRSKTWIRVTTNKGSTLFPYFPLIILHKL